jgi:peptidyl-prolyl cis-trans isomerase-like 4
MAVAPALEGHEGGCGSQFFATLSNNIDYLDEKHAVFGHVVEVIETLDKLNEGCEDQACCSWCVSFLLLWLDSMIEFV